MILVQRKSTINELVRHLSPIHRKGKQGEIKTQGVARSSFRLHTIEYIFPIYPIARYFPRNGIQNSEFPVCNKDSKIGLINLEACEVLLSSSNIAK
jgi:hypothetical protein